VRDQQGVGAHAHAVHPALCLRCLQGCGHLTEAGLLHLTPLHRLRLLRTSMALSPEPGLRALAGGCAASLQLLAAESLSAAQDEALAAALPALTALSLSLTTTSTPSLAALAPRLTALAVAGASDQGLIR
jgi:hypothetical protein